MKKILLYLICFSSVSLFSQEMISLYEMIPNPVGMAAIGGRHAAMVDGYLGLYQNPASFASAEPETNLSSIDMSIGGPVFSMLGLYLQYAGGKDMADLISSDDAAQVLTGSYASLDLKGPIAFGFVGKGLGFGINMHTGVSFESAGSLAFKAFVSEAIDLRGGYAMRFDLPYGMKIDTGFMFKGVLQAQVYDNISLVSELSGGSDLQNDPMGYLMTKVPYRMTLGLGLDVGIQYHLNELFSFGITAHDVFAPISVTAYDNVQAYLDGTGTSNAQDVWVPQDISLGIRFSPPLGPVSTYIEGLDLYIDYNNFFDFLLNPDYADNIILKFSAGVDLSLLSILKLRGGFNRGLPAAGLEMDLTYFTFNFIMYGKELSSEPGVRSVFNFGFSLDFRY